MGKNNNIIEINGKRYDARTGAHIGHTSHSTVQHAPKAVRNIDGVHRKARPATAKPATPHKTQAPKTLRRDVVKKPAATPKSHIKTVAHTGALAKQPVVVKPSVTRLDQQRLRHAKHVPQSKLISRFGPEQPAQPTPLLMTAPTPVPTAQPIPPVRRAAAPVKPAKPKTTADLIEHALKHASSHTEHAPKSKKRAGGRFKRARQITGVSVAALSLLLVVGLASTQSIDMVRFKMASARAGFSVGMPGYQPSGFSLDKLTYGTGMVSAHFHSNSDDRKYTITERASNWDSQGLRDSFILGQDSGFQTVEAAGRTIYTYGNGNATWVSNGIWYQVQANGSLSVRQLVSLATSL